MIQSSYFPQAKIWTVDADKPVAEVSSAIEEILNDALGK